MRGRRSPGALESAVLAAVAAMSRPVSVADVLEVLPGRPAYTTVMTTLARLHDKGALDRTQVGRAFHYSLTAPPAAVEDAVTARRMHRLLTQGGDRAGVLARFVSELNPDDERLLTGLLAGDQDAGDPDAGVRAWKTRGRSPVTSRAPESSDSLADSPDHPLDKHADGRPQK